MGTRKGHDNNVEKWLQFMKPYLEQHHEVVIVGSLTIEMIRRLTSNYPLGYFVFVDPHFDSSVLENIGSFFDRIGYINTLSGAQKLSERITRSPHLVPVLGYRPSWQTNRALYEDLYRTLVGTPEKSHPQGLVENILGSLFQ